VRARLYLVASLCSLFLRAEYRRGSLTNYSTDVKYATSGTCIHREYITLDLV